MKPKRILLCGMGVMATYIVMAQDVIVMKDGNLIQSKVKEITPTEIKYRKYSNLEGPLYTIDKKNVLAVHYESGDKDTFSTDEKGQTEQSQNSSDASAGRIETVPDEANALLIEQYNKLVTFKEKPSSSIAKEVAVKFGITNGSILSNKDVEIRFELKRDAVCCQYVIVIRNKTDRILYIDRGNSFRIESDGSSYVYFDGSEQTTVTQGGSSGGSLGLGSVANVLGIGGTVGTLANGVSVGGGSSHSASTTYAVQRVIAIPPHGEKRLSEHKELVVKERVFSSDKTKTVSHGEKFSWLYGLKRGIVQKNAVRIFDEEDSPYKREYLITYSTEETFATYSSISLGLFAQQVFGKSIDLFYAEPYSVDKMIKRRKKFIVDYTDKCILGEMWLRD